MFLNPSSGPLQFAQSLLPFVDHTLLSGSETETDIAKLVATGREFYPAAFCVYPRWIKAVAAHMHDMGIDARIAAVVQFPNGNEMENSELGALIEKAVVDGATQIDTVFDRTSFFEGKFDAVRNSLSLCREITARHDVAMKVIMETGAFYTQDGVLRDVLLHDASMMALECDPDCLKTSTGKLEPFATPETVEILCRAILESGKDVGLKIAGGVGTLEQARAYAWQVMGLMGPEFMRPDRLRFGSSSLFPRTLNLVKGLAAPAGQPAY